MRCGIESLLPGGCPGQRPRHNTTTRLTTVRPCSQASHRLSNQFLPLFCARPGVLELLELLPVRAEEVSPGRRFRRVGGTVAWVRALWERNQLSFERIRVPCALPYRLRLFVRALRGPMRHGYCWCIPAGPGAPVARQLMIMSLRPGGKGERDGPGGRWETFFR